MVSKVSKRLVICADTSSAADIIACMQTVRMVGVSLLPDTSVEKRCNIASSMLDALSTVPTAYIQAISSPMVSASQSDRD